MNKIEPIEKAKQSIGDNRPDDYIINPTKHAEQFKEIAPELANILDSSDVKVAAQEYEDLDKEAIESQKEFKKQSNRAHWSMFFTTFFSASLAISASWSALFHIDERITGYIIVFFALGSALFAAATGICIRQIRYWKLLEKWMENRAKAEEKRLSYFYKIVNNKAKKKSSPLLNLLKLEYFRRFQLDVQTSYYHVRSSQHEKSAKKYLSCSIYAMGLVTFLNVLAGSLGFFSNPQLTALAVLALLSQTFATILTNIESVNQDRRNAERYKRTRSALLNLNAKLDEVRTEIHKGNSKILTNFIEAVNEPLSAEHRQWLASFEDRFSAIGRLEQQLKKTKPEDQKQDSE